jgi:hypothetical protein
LQAALASRAGDFKRSAHHTGVEYLKWEDIELKLGRDSSKEDPKFTTLITLKYRKGHKQVPPADSILPLKS